MLDLDAIVASVLGGKTKKSPKKRPSTQNSMETIFSYLEADGVGWEGGVFYFDQDTDYGDPTGVVWLTETKPSEAVRSRLKAAGMRWYPLKKLWYLPKTRFSPLSELSQKTVTAFNKAIGFTPASLAR